MSIAPITTPLHTPLHTFTSTMTDTTNNKPHLPGFNYYVVILTAVIFFTVLSWFNFVLAWYGTVTSDDPNHKDNTVNTLGFAVLWTLIAVSIYIVMNYYGVLGHNIDSEPLLRGENRDVSGRYLGEIDMARI